MRKYKHNYLTSVTARLDFAVPPEDLDKDLPEDLSAELKKDFPIAAIPVEIFKQAVGVNPLGANVEIQRLEKWKRWDFYNKRKEKFIRIERDFFCIQYNTYKTFRTLKSDFLKLVKLTNSFFPDMTFTRLGLRYIDTFSFPKELKPIDWKKWVNKKLLVSLSVPPLKEQRFITRALQTLELNYEDMQLRFVYGIFNTDYPAPVKRKDFIFDTDAFCACLLEAEEIDLKLGMLHTKIKEFFEANITPAMREHLNAPKRK